MDGMSFSDSGQQYSIWYSTVRSAECKFTNKGDMQSIQQPSNSSEWIYLKKEKNQKNPKMFQFCCSGRWNWCISNQLQLCTATREQSTQQEEGSCALIYTRQSKFNNRHAKHTTALISKLQSLNMFTIPSIKNYFKNKLYDDANELHPTLCQKRVPKNNQRFRDSTKNWMEVMVTCHQLNNW